jgi:class 3 adenylate cyclase
LKIGAFAVLLVIGVSAAVWCWAIWLPALRERDRREQEYTQISRMLGASGALSPDALKSPAMHPDLVYVIRARKGTPTLESSAVHGDRLASLDAALAASWSADSIAALKVLYPLRSGSLPGLMVKRVILKTDAGEQEMLLGFSKLSLERALRERLLSSAAVLAVSLALAMLGAFLLGGMITRPVRELAAAMERTGKGAYEAVSPSSRDEVGQLARAFNDMVRGLKERERLKTTLARYVSDDVATRLLTESSDLDIKGELRRVTVLFLDIRGFTSISERLPPREIVSMLNEYFEIIIEVIFKHHGTINKFIGDAIMAIFGAPFDIDDPAMRAVRTAVEIEQRIALLNHKRRAAGKLVVAMGIGINTGQAIAGNIGSERRMEYTVIGDEVNLAQRLESAAREGEILISHSTFLEVKGRIDFRARDPVALKGKALPIEVYEVVGMTG